MDSQNIKLSHGDIVAKGETIQRLIIEKFDEFNITQAEDYHNAVSEIKELLFRLLDDLFEEHDETLHRIAFVKIHDVFMPTLKAKFYEEDVRFFEKCKALCDFNVSADHFGGDENYSIPLTAAIVELSILDSYDSPMQKMNCLSAAYDLLYAELKTAIVSMISKKPDDEQEFPILNTDDVTPVLMVVIIKSKLVHIFSNLFYIKNFYYKPEDNNDLTHIFGAFETAIEEINKIDIKKLEPKHGKIRKQMDPQEYMRLTAQEEQTMTLSTNKTLVDEENERILKLIARSTSEFF